MSNPEDEVHGLELEPRELGNGADSQRSNGRKGFRHAGLWFTAGAFMSKAFLEVTGRAEHISDLRQYSFIAMGGLATAATVFLNGHRTRGTNPLELAYRRKNQQNAELFYAQQKEISSWVAGPQPLDPYQEKLVRQFAEHLDELPEPEA